MPNSLLDFVMSVVRDPDVAAHYAADPAQAIADANLTDVSTTDVNHLIPVVAESLSSAVPSTGVDAFGADAGHNVWASGAATAAFDAFGAAGDQLPQQVVDDPGGVINDLVGSSGHSVLDPAAADLDVPTVAGTDDPGLHLDVPADLDVPVVDTGAEQDWTHHLVDDHQPVDHPVDLGFDDLI